MLAQEAIRGRLEVRLWWNAPSFAAAQGIVDELANSSAIERRTNPARAQVRRYAVALMLARELG